MVPDYYSILGIKSSANLNEIKKSYRKLALLHHPDKDTSPGAHDKFISIHEAYSILSGVETRLKYDREYSKQVNSTFSPQYNSSTSKAKQDSNSKKDSKTSNENTIFSDNDLDTEARKARHTAEAFTKMAFSEFSKTLITAVTETGFQISNVVVGVIGGLLLIAGVNDSILYFTTGFAKGNIFMVVIAGVGFYLIHYARKRETKRNQ